MDFHANWADVRYRIGHALKHHPLIVSVYEALFVFIFSNISLPFLVFVHVVSTPQEKLSLAVAIRVIREAVSSTEIFVYILALIAPALWVMVHNWRARRHPGLFFTLLILQGMIVCCCAYIYGKAKFGGIENQPFVDSWAITCYLIGLMIWYISLVYDKVLKPTDIPSMPPSGASIMKELG